MESKPKKLAPTDSLYAKLFQFFFWSCYSRSLDLENTVATSNEFFYLKNSYISVKKKKKNFLSPLIATNTTIFLSNIFKLKHNKIIRIQTQKHNFKINQIITIKPKKKKKKKWKIEDRSHWPIWTAFRMKMSDDTVTHLSCSFSLYLFSFFSYHGES